MSFYPRLRSSFRAMLVLQLLMIPLTDAKEDTKAAKDDRNDIMASEVRAFINNQQTNVQAVLEDITPASTKLRDLIATAAELNVLSGISARVTATHLNTLTAGSTSNADALHTHSIGDAGTLDGLDSTQFLRSDVSDTFEGTTLTVDGDIALASGGTLSSTANGNITINPNGDGIIALGISSNKTNVTISGDVSISGNLWNPAVFNLTRQVKSLDSAVMELQSENSFKPMFKELEQNLPNLIRDIDSIREHVIIEDSKPVVVNESLHVEGDLNIEGFITNTIPSKNLGHTTLYTHQSLHPYLYERGEGELIGGEARIELSLAFLDAVLIDEGHPLFVKTTLLSAHCHELAVVERHPPYFYVKELYQGTSNCPFLWEASAQRKEGSPKNNDPRVDDPRVDDPNHFERR